MKQSEATELLDQKLATDFATANPGVAYALNNETFRPVTRPFVVFIIAGVTPQQRSMGPVGKRRVEYRGTFAAQVFGELDKGTKEVDLIVDSFREIFQLKHFSAVGDPLWTREVIASNPIQRDGLHLVVATCAFVFYNIE